MSSYYKHNSENKTHTLDIQSKVKLRQYLYYEYNLSELNS